MSSSKLVIKLVDKLVRTKTTRVLSIKFCQDLYILAAHSTLHCYVAYMRFLSGCEMSFNVEQCEGFYVFYNEKAWMNQNLIKKWTDLVVPIINYSDGKNA